MPEFNFADFYTYLIGSEEEYTAEKLKSFKSLQGYKLFADSHVQGALTKPGAVWIGSD